MNQVENKDNEDNVEDGTSPPRECEEEEGKREENEDEMKRAQN